MDERRRTYPIYYKPIVKCTSFVGMLGKLEPRTVDRGQTGFCTEPDERESDKQQNGQKFKAQVKKLACALCFYRKTVSFIGDGSEMRFIWHCVSLPSQIRSNQLLQLTSNMLKCVDVDFQKLQTEIPLDGRA